MPSIVFRGSFQNNYFLKSIKPNDSHHFFMPKGFKILEFAFGSIISFNIWLIKDFDGTYLAFVIDIRSHIESSLEKVTEIVYFSWSSTVYL